MDWTEELHESVTFTETPEPELSYGSELAFAISTASILKELGEFDDVVKDALLKHFDAWLETVTPIMYTSGLAEVLGDRIKGDITSIFERMTEDELASLLDAVSRLKVSDSVETNDVKEVFYYVMKLLDGLGVDVTELKDYIDFTDPRSTLSSLIAVIATALSIVISRG